MANIVPTTLTTDQPQDAGKLTLCDGFAMFKWLGTARAGATLNFFNGTWFDKTLNFELFKIDMAGYHTNFIGICGPAYAVEIDQTEDTNYTVPSPGQPSSGQLVIDDHALRGGFQAGFDFQVLIDFSLTLNLIFKKKRLVDTDANIDIDVIKLIIELLEALLSGGGGGQAKGNPNDIEMSTFSEGAGETQVAEGTQGAEGSAGGEGGKGVKAEFSGAGMVDYIARPWLPFRGQVTTGPPQATLEPSLAYGFSIVPLFADIPFLDILYGLDEVLEKIGGGFELGPGVSIGLPTTVKLKGATISNHPFDATQASAGSGTTNQEATVNLQERTPIDPHLQPLTDHADEIGAILEHEVGISVGLYFFVEISFFKVIHIGAQTGTFPIFYTDTLPGNAGGPWENDLSFIPGGGPVPFGPPTDVPDVGPYTANQPQGRWQGGILAQYGVSFFNASYETPIGPFSALDPEDRFFAFPQLTNIPTGPLVADGDPIAGRNIYRLFNDGSAVELVGTINDNSTTTFTDTKP